MFNNKFIYSLFLPIALVLINEVCFGQSTVTFNRVPLKNNVYAELPLGSIKAKGWLLKQLEN
jgi:hypothetical protein